MALKKVLKNPLVQRFTALVEGEWNAAGWGEYLLWEILEGKRDRPFFNLPPLTSEELEMCQKLRDELKVWPSWAGVWELADIDEWREHANHTSANDARDALGVA